MFRTIRIHLAKFGFRGVLKKLIATGIALVPDKVDPVDLAATTTVTRALLNLQETITRY